MWSSTRVENVSNTCLDVWQKIINKEKNENKNARARVVFSIRYFDCPILYICVCVYMQSVTILPISYISLTSFPVHIFHSYSPPIDLVRLRPSGAFVFLGIIIIIIIFVMPT